MWPKSEALQRSHAPRVQALLQALTDGEGERCLSECAFANLWLFRREHRYRFVDGLWPCICGLTYDGVAHVMPLFDLRLAPPEVLDALFQQGDCLYPITRAQAQAMDPQLYRVDVNLNDADYLYPAENFRHYRGELLGKKRNLMKQLLKHHEVQAQVYSPSAQALAHSVLSGWMQDKGLPAGGADEWPCTEALANAETLGLEGFVYTVDGQPGGFVLAQALQPGVYAMRFAKSLHCFKGLAQYMFHHFCTAREEVQWLNFEQDLGSPNFRQTKQSYQPAALLEKCRIYLRAGEAPTIVI